MISDKSFYLPFSLPVVVTTKIYFRVHPSGLLMPTEALLLLSYEVTNETYDYFGKAELPTVRIKAVTPSGSLVTIKKQYDEFITAVRQEDVCPLPSQ